VRGWSCLGSNGRSLTFAEYNMFKYLPAFVSAFTLVTAAGCGSVKNPGNTVIDCLAADRAKIDTLIADLATKTRADGSRDWSAIETDAISAGVTIGGCALAEFIGSLLQPQHVEAASDEALARQTLEHFRSTQAGNATFKTRLGTL
jgi:hypothetical protein